MPGFEVYDNKEKEAALSVFDEGNVLFSHGFHGLGRNTMFTNSMQLANHISM